VWEKDVETKRNGADVAQRHWSSEAMARARDPFNFGGVSFETRVPRVKVVIATYSGRIPGKRPGRRHLAMSDEQQGPDGYQQFIRALWVE
jgi:hypothetical protein